MSNRLRKHAKRHEDGGLDPLTLSKIAGVISDAQHGTKTTIPNAHHTKLTLTMLSAPVTKISTTSPPTTYTDVDCTSETSTTARSLLVYVDFAHDIAAKRLYIRENGVESGGIYNDGAFVISTPLADAYHRIGLIVIPLDVTQIFEYKVDAYTSSRVIIIIFGYLE